LSFDKPAYLYFLLLLIAFIPFVVVRYFKGREKAALFAAAAPSKRRGPLLNELRLRIIISDVFFIFFMGFLIIALAGPRWGLRIVTDYRRGVDVVLAFDLSRSMNVDDCSAQGILQQKNISRLERGKEIAQELVNSLGELRIGTAIGKGTGILAIPLTYDSEAVLNFLNALDNQAFSGRGTDLESLLNAALGAFQDSIPSRRWIILFSDGETLSGSFQKAIEKARKAGIIISTVGLGSDAGGPVPLEKWPEASSGFLLGADNKPVISKRNADILRNGAEKSGGIYIDGSRNDAARFLAGHINSLTAESRLQGQRRESNPRWRFFVLAAMICLSVVRLMGFSRRNRKQVFLPVLLCLLMFSSCARTQGRLLIMEANFYSTRGFYTEAISSYLMAREYNEAVPYAEYGLASAFFALDEGGAALDRYKGAEWALGLTRENHPELKYRIYYNMGIIYFENGEYEEAVGAFRDALKIDGSRIEAKRNLELSLLSLARSSSPQTVSSQETSGGRKGSNGEDSILFEYLRAKEQEQWKSREWTGEFDQSGPDY
jgi:Ca-activated chloride channel family protein